MDPIERALLHETVRAAIADAPSTSRDSADVDQVLSGLGWLDMLEAEPRDAIEVVFTALGTTNATATALDDVVLAALGMEPRPELAVVLPAFATYEVPGRARSGATHATGLTSARITTATSLVVVRAGDGGLERVLVSADTVDRRPVRGVDPDAGLYTVDIQQSATDSAPLEPAAWGSGLAAGRRAVAHQIAGSTRTMLDLARTHAMERVQFGRPVARFQAVRHRLADALVAIEALEATLTAAWDELVPMTAALAKATAGRTARTVGAHCQQVLAGIGFTTDHPFHRFLKRTMALEGLFGSTDAIALDIGHQLLAARAVPTLVEL
jgi:acyl-CoA dehydrogenase-like protein